LNASGQVMTASEPTIEKFFLSHTHVDHTGGAKRRLAKLDRRIECHREQINFGSMRHPHKVNNSACALARRRSR